MTEMVRDLADTIGDLAAAIVVGFTMCVVIAGVYGVMLWTTLGRLAKGTAQLKRHDGELAGLRDDLGAVCDHLGIVIVPADDAGDDDTVELPAIGDDTAPMPITDVTPAVAARRGLAWDDAAARLSRPTPYPRDTVVDPDPWRAQFTFSAAGRHSVPAAHLEHDTDGGD